MNGFRIPWSNGRTAAWLLVGLVGLGAPLGAQAPPVRALAVLVAPPGATREVKPSSSLPVVAVRARESRPIASGEILVDLDVSRLERDLERAQKKLLDAQEAQRYRTADQEVRPGGGSTGQATGLGGGESPTGGVEAELAFAVADAMREIQHAQSRLASAAVRAPADGFVVRQLAEAGVVAKKRKPILLFIEARSTRLETTIPSDAAYPYTPGREVSVASLAEPERTFVGRVEAAEAVAEGVRLRIRPESLPFLPLDTETSVTLSTAH